MHWDSAVAPSLRVIVEGEHLSHLSALEAFEYIPIEHSWHGASPTGPKDPGLHINLHAESDAELVPAVEEFLSHGRHEA